MSLSAESVRIVDRLASVAPLGLRFVDAATGGIVGDGLVVTAYPVGQPRRRVRAIVNRTRTWVLQGLPGLRDLEQGAGDPAYWAGITAPRPFVVEVTDESGRFLPCHVQVGLPVKGLFRWRCGSPPMETPADAVPLYSAPARSVPAGLAAIRARLWDHTGGRPAAWAMLDAHDSHGPLGRGMADARGEVALICPYPEPAGFPVTSPPGSPPAEEAGPSPQTWTIRLAAAYSPAASGARPAGEPAPVGPELCPTLTQRPAVLWRDPAAGVPLGDLTLTFGREVVARSGDPQADPPLSMLFVTANGSPP